MDRTGQTFEGRYRLQRRLGHGGMAEVYAALDLRLDKAVAVKVMTAECAALPRVAQRFVQEARAASRIRHANVLDVTDFGVADDGVAFLVMELLRGEDLAATLEREGPLPWSRVGPIALQICAALAAAHRVGVIHRDIKPSNCFRLHAPGNPDFIKVLDFGIARVLDPGRRVAEPTTAGTVLGTPEYMAPEVAAGDDAGPRSDLYGVGALIYKLLLGAPPFVGDSYQAILSKQIFEPPVPLRRRAPEREIPEAVDALVLRALAKDPAQRPADMAALAAAIADTLPQRPAVELWFEPTTLEPTASLVLPVAEPTRGPVTRPLASDGAPRGGRTVPLAPPLAPPRRPRRWPLVVAGSALALAAVAAVVLRAPAGDPPDMSASTGLGEHARRSMPLGPADSSPASPPSGAPAPAGMSPETGAPPAASAGAAPPTGAPSAAGGEAPPAADASPPAQPPSEAADAKSGSARVRVGRPRFDVEAARRELQRHARAVQTCALASDMLRGDVRLQVTIDDRGRLAAVEAAAGSRRVESAALSCIRRALADLRLAPVAGVLAEDFTI